METGKNSKSGKYSFIIGIVSGFVFLAALFDVLDGKALKTYEVFAWVGLCSISSAIFLMSSEQRKKSCKTSAFR